MPVNEICPLCPSRATEDHHIIRRAQMPGSLFEDWDLNKIGLCTRCHAENHGSKPVEAEVFWAAKNYSKKELMLLAFIAVLPPPKSGISHMMKRVRWIIEYHPWVGELLDILGSDYMRGRCPELIADLEIPKSKVPKWIAKAIEEAK